MTGMRSLVSFLGGAVSVGLVVGVLAIAGVIGDGKTTTVVTSTGTGAAPPARGAKVVNTQPTNVSEIYRRVSPGVVFVESSGNGGGLRGGQAATGSRFVYQPPGPIVTNHH